MRFLGVTNGWLLRSSVIHMFKALKSSVHHHPPPIYKNKAIHKMIKNAHPYETHHHMHHMTSFPPQVMIYTARHACDSFWNLAALKRLKEDGRLFHKIGITGPRILNPENKYAFMCQNRLKLYGHFVIFVIC